VAFDCTSQEKAAHGHVVYAVQEMSKTASKGAQNGSHCPGNERCAVKEPLPTASISCTIGKMTLQVNCEPSTARHRGLIFSRMDLPENVHIQMRACSVSVQRHIEKLRWLPVPSQSVLRSNLVHLPAFHFRICEDGFEQALVELKA
jgi:hypothetical protein